MQTAPVSEIFVSVQGEGIFVGQRQLFLRLAGCNLECVYCDTNTSVPAYAIIYEDSQPAPVRLANPLDTATVCKIIQQIINQEHLPLPVSVTGGEPLLRSQFLKELLPQLKELHLKIFLETNGILPQNLIDVVDFLDGLGMDLKLPSQVKGASYLTAQKEFLQIAIRVPNLFLKIIVTPAATLEELTEVLEITKELTILPPLVLQPVTTLGKLGVECEKLLTWQKELAKTFPQVLLIPQTHVFLGVK